MAELLADPEERSRKAEHILNLLKCIPKTEVFISNCDQESDNSSDLPDPFADDEDPFDSKQPLIENSKGSKVNTIYKHMYI